MAQLDFRSPGVSTREIDTTTGTALQSTGIPAGVVSTTQLGAAFVPVTIPTYQDWKTIFGNPVTGIKFGALTAAEWFKTQQALTQLRVLGAGDGTQRTTSGINRGRVNSSGFVVGDQQPQATLSGGLGNNLLANALSATPAATGSAGRTYFLGCFMSQSTNSTIFTDAGLTLPSTPVIRGIIFAASGVLLQLSSSQVPSSSVPNSTQAAEFAAGTVKGSFLGALKLSSSLQEFVLLLNGKTADTQNPNVLTCSFDPNASNYFGNVLNKDPLKMENAGLYLYAQWDVYPSLAVPTGSGVVIPASGANSTTYNGYENIAFVVTGAASRNSGSIYAPNYENFEDRYRTASTPWIVSQLFGGKPENLFKVWSLSDGTTANTLIKISIENITPSINTMNQYGTFDLVVRDFNDIDGNKIILEQWRGLTLNPKSDKFIGKIIGDLYTYFNWDANSDSQKLETVGDYPVNSRYIRVELTENVKNAETPETALPFGFRGPRHLVTSGSAPMPTYNDLNYFTLPNIFNNLTELPVPYRLNLTKGTSPNLSVDRTLYWGIQFEQVTSALEPNASSAQNKGMYSNTRYFPNFHTDFQNFVVENNAGVLDTTQNGILDADRFNNNLFSLEKIRVAYNSTTNLPDVNKLTTWAYIRSGNIGLDSANLTRGLKMSDLVDPAVRNVSKFTVHLAGGFDGTRIFDKDCNLLTNKAITEEVNNGSRGFQAGPTVIAYQKAIDIMKNTLEVDIQLFATPGIRHKVITDYAIAAIQNDRFDCFYIFDIEQKDINNNDVLATNQIVSVKNTITNFRLRNLDSSFAATYFPDVVIKDDFNNTVENVPPSVVALGAFGKNDSVGHPWFAPAGFNRTSLDSVRNASIPLSRTNLSDLYSERINSLISFSGQQPVIWGQKTVLAPSGNPLERINVRRMLLAVRRQVKKVGYRIMFEPNREETLKRFQKLVDPILNTVQSQGGLNGYSVQINTETTTQADIENKVIRGKIFVVPTRALEIVDLDFVVNNRGNFSVTG